MVDFPHTKITIPNHLLNRYRFLIVQETVNIKTAYHLEGIPSACRTYLSIPFRQQTAEIMSDKGEQVTARVSVPRLRFF